MRRNSHSKSNQLRAGIYSRTSKAKSKAGVKYENKCRNFCEEKGWRVVEEFVINEVGSPSTVERPGLKSILEGARQRNFDVLVIYEFGILSKNSDQSEFIIDQLAKHGIEIAIVHDLTPEEMKDKFDRLPAEQQQFVRAKVTNMMLKLFNRSN